MTNVKVMETQGTWSFFSCLWLYRIITHKVLSLVLKHPFPITFFWHPCTGLDVGEIFVGILLTCLCFWFCLFAFLSCLTSSPSGNPIGFVFKIYQEYNLFSPSPPFPACPETSSRLNYCIHLLTELFLLPQKCHSPNPILAVIFKM